jgi:hypothetical protein
MNSGRSPSLRQSARNPRTPRKLKPDRAVDINLTNLDGDRAVGNAGAILFWRILQHGREGISYQNNARNRAFA